MFTIKDIGEFGLIERLSKKIKTDKSVVLGIGDDTAVVEWNKDKYLLITSDMLIEGKHFLKKDDPNKVGHKALACSISDIAAMGGVAKYAVISLGLPKGTTVRYIDKIYQGINRLANKFNINIVGGDMNSSDKLIIDVVVLGRTDKKRLVLRSNAKQGDSIFVTGKLGPSFKGIGKAYPSGLGGSLKSGHHLNFIPKLKESNYLVDNFKVNSMIDISDGLLADLGHIIKQSKVGAVIYEELISINRYAKSLQDALCTGEDFELLFTMPRKEAIVFKKKKHPKGMHFYYIGEIINKPKKILLIDRLFRCNPLKPKGFQHF